MSENLRMNTSDTRKLQDCLLSMYIEINELCKKENIKLILGGGTMLGAIRHDGFIPWDDDLDLMLFRCDVEKFVSSINQNYASKYYVESLYTNDKTCIPYLKIRLKNSLLKEKAAVNYPSGNEVFIDIFIFENTPNNGGLRYLRGHISNMLKSTCNLVVSHKYSPELIYRDKSIKTKSKKVIVSILSVINERIWLKMYDSVNNSNNKNSTFISIPTGRKGYFGELYEREMFENYRTKQFEGYDAMICNNPQKYLSQLYGEDYLVIPDESKRESHNIIEFYLPEGFDSK